MIKYILTGYIESAMSHAEYSKLEDGTFSGSPPLQRSDRIRKDITGMQKGITIDTRRLDSSMLEIGSPFANNR